VRIIVSCSCTCILCPSSPSFPKIRGFGAGRERANRIRQLYRSLSCQKSYHQKTQARQLAPFLPTKYSHSLLPTSSSLVRRSGLFLPFSVHQRTLTNLPSSNETRTCQFCWLLGLQSLHTNSELRGVEFLPSLIELPTTSESPQKLQND